MHWMYTRVTGKYTYADLTLQQSWRQDISLVLVFVYTHPVAERHEKLRENDISIPILIHLSHTRDKSFRRADFL